jgi:UDP-N-acetylmuramate dehydrogenase
MKILHNIPLAPYTTFRIGGPARFFCRASTEADIAAAVEFARQQDVPFFILGGGSNVLVSDQGYAGLVIKNEIKGAACDTRGGVILVSAGSGMVWDTLVAYTVRRGLYGLENLSKIPGTVGASPVQNIGAYGVEVGNLIESVRAFDTVLRKFVELSAKQCQFEYRDSLFKRQKGRYIITRVTYRLRRKGTLQIDYKDLVEYFARKPRGIEASARPTLASVRRAIISIRRRKLPNWKAWGTAGSFFKNPMVSATLYRRLKRKNPDMLGLPVDNGRVKIPLAWILDKICHAKGLMVGNVGTYEKQALVVVTRCGATAEEVVAFTQELMAVVKQATGIKIAAEVEWVAA